MKNKILLIMLSEIIGLSYLVAQNTNCNYALSSNGSTATAISEGTYLGITHYASWANDGDLNSGWASQWDMPAWIKIDLGQIRQIDLIGIVWSAHQQGFTISLSTDGSNWNQVVAGQSCNTEAGPPVHELYPIATTSARYVKVDINSTSAPSSHIFQAVLNEIEIWSDSCQSFAQCHIPSTIGCRSATSTSLGLDWDAVSGATSYNVRYRANGASTWTTLTGQSLDATISGITPNTTEYQWQAQTVCSGDTSGWSVFMYCGGTTGISDFTSIRNLILSPNPTTGTFTLEMELIQPEPLQLYILNSIGQVVYDEELGNHIGSYQKTIDLSSRAKGVYLLQVAGKEGVLGRKIVVY